MKKIYFLSDAHLGSRAMTNNRERERKLCAFLDSVRCDASAIYLLGDIWDFWYEYRDVVPKGYIRVLSALQALMDKGVKVCFFQGNHDVWTYKYFEELGMIRLEQPALVEIGGKVFCLGHGDGLGPVPFGYRFLRGVFHNRFLQFLFSLLHPWLAFRLGNSWSRSNRLSHDRQYVFRGEDEPLYKFADKFSRENKVDYFVFGHYHSEVTDMKLPSGASLYLLKDWMDGVSYLYFDGISTFGGSFQNSEK